MTQVIKFRISLLRERLSIHGWHNIIMFFALLVAIAVAGKFLLAIIGDYSVVGVIETALFCCMCGSVIFPKNINGKICAVKLFFDKVDVHAYEKYLTYRKYVYFQVAYLYVMVPTNWNNWHIFPLFFLVFELFAFTTVLVRRYCKTATFHSFIQNASTLICLGLFLTRRDVFDFVENVYIPTKTAVVLSSIGLLCMVFTIRKLKECTGLSVQYRTLIKPRAKSIRINKDILYVLRSDTLREPIVLMMTSGVLSYALRETAGDMLLTNALSCSYAFCDVYFRLLRYENKSYMLLYSQKKHREFKKEKIKNTLFILLPVLAIISVPLAYVTSVQSVAIAFIVTPLLFTINALLFKVSIEKGRGYKVVATEREYICFLIANEIQIIVMYVLKMLCAK